VDLVQPGVPAEPYRLLKLLIIAGSYLLFHLLFLVLQTIPGIGKSTAMHLIVVSDGFRKFENAKQFTCYIGLSPVEILSGSSVNGKTSISKQGNGKVRNLLFLCSFNA
jgi:transposase